MILELHLIQNFAPSNLNRSDTGSPKDCTFGGFRRARISSQCFKNSMRKFFEQTKLAPDNLAVRSKRLHDLLIEKIGEKTKDDGGFENIEFAAEAILALNGISFVEKTAETADEEETSSDWVSKSEALAFLGNDNLNKIIDFVVANKIEVGKAAEIFKAYREKKRAAKDYKGKIVGEDKKKLRGAVKTALGKELAESIEKILDGKRAADIALFGRMLADLPTKNVEAASQVAHAISTHKVGMEFDFYTAVDQLRPDDTAGADMLGTVEFNSACFYRYLNVDVTELQKNLQGDEDLTKATVEAFIRSAISAIPTGKQNSFATHEKPNFVLAVVREAGMCSLANAFEKPAKANQTKGLVEDSIEKFAEHWDEVSGVYGDDAKAKNLIKTTNADLKGLKDSDSGNVNTLISNTMNAIFA